MNTRDKEEVLHLMKSIAQKYLGAKRLLETIPNDFDKVWEIIDDSDNSVNST